MVQAVKRGRATRFGALGDSGTASILSDLGSTARIVAGRRPRSEGAVVFAYHDVREDGNGYHVTPAQLRAHLELARAAGLRFVDVATVVDRLQQGRPVDGLAAVTFDDALLGVGKHAMAILDDVDVTATIFVVTDRLGVGPDWWDNAQRTLSAAELTIMADSSRFSFGSHTRSHPSLPSLQAVALADELEGSRTCLEDLLGRSVDLLAYPSGHHDARVRAAARQGGYRAGFTFLNGRAVAGDDLFRFPRLTMGGHHHRLRLAYHLGRSKGSWPDTQLDAVTAT
jgi:peptidoglycan/xylan/chitin deacetylase (PgdA/CDA1 family)